MTRVSVVGLGKLGACMAAAFAHRGFLTIGVDINNRTVELLNQRQPPVFEPGLEALLQGVGDRLRATRDYGDAVTNSEVTFVVVPTPSQDGGAFSVRYAVAAARSIGEALRAKPKPHLVVLCSTVLPGSTEYAFKPALEKASGKQCGKDFRLCYSPEFIALGSVIRDFLNPDFALIGEATPESGECLAAIYADLFKNKPPIARMSVINAELTKLAVNTYVTAKITFANLLAEICERLPGGDVDVITSALGLDSRIGRKYLRGALGYGGTCFPRDNLAFSFLLEKMGVPANLPRTVDRMNRRVAQRVAEMAKRALGSNGGKVGVLGLAYKPATNVVEESQGIDVARRLTSEGVEVIVYDPVAMHEARRSLKDSVVYAASVEECAREAKVLVVTIPCPEFQFSTLTGSSSSSKPVIIDGWRMARSHGEGNADGYLSIGLGSPGAEAERRLKEFVDRILNHT